MSQLKVNNITNEFDDGPVTFDKGIIADGSQLTLKPTTQSFDPKPLATTVGVSSTITIGFNQDMQFLGTGDIRIREASASGTITTSFTTGVSTEINISGGVLTIDPKDDLDYGTTYFVTLPSVGIANTLGAYIAELDTYQFQTEFRTFDIQGGDYTGILVSPTSPTGYHKYNIFTSSGIVTFSGPSSTAEDLDYVLVGGGGGGGGAYYSGGGGGAGGLVKNYNVSNIPGGSYTITIGAGGPGTFNNPNGTTSPPTLPPNNPGGGPWPIIAQPGSNSTFGPTPVGTIVAYGGGRGGLGRQYGYPLPAYERNSSVNQSTPTFYLAGASGGSGGGGSYDPTSPWGPPTSPPGYNPPTFNGSGIFGGQAISYPSPNAQGNPGGSTSVYPSQRWSGSTYLGGGGGGAGGAGGNVRETPPQGPAGPNPNHKNGGGGGSGASNPEFNGTQLLLLGLPSVICNEMGTGGNLAGGGGPGCNVDSSAQWPQGPSNAWTPNTVARGGPGGGGDGRYQRAGSNPYPNHPAEAGYQNMGGGGGGGYTSAGPTGTFPTPGPGDWFGLPGGSGVMMFRYAHPGS